MVAVIEISLLSGADLDGSILASLLFYMCDELLDEPAAHSCDCRQKTFEMI